MSSTTGASWQLGRYSGATPYAIGGKLVGVPAIEKHGENTMQAGTGTRKTDLHATNLYWSLDFRMKLQKIASYLSAYAMITAEGVLPTHNLYTYDGISKRGFTGCLVDKANVEIGQTGAIMADFSVIALANAAADLTITPDSEAPMTKSAVSALTVGSPLQTHFTSIRFGIDNHVMRQASGTTDLITDVYAKEATYTVDIEIIKKAELAYGYGTTKQQTIELTLTNNQLPTGIATKFTWANMAVRSNAYRVDELGLTFERISAEGNSLVITA